jgi:hypothetical protein
MIFTFLGLPHYGEWLTMHKSLVTEMTPCLKDISVFSISCYNALCNTVLSLKFELRWTPLSKEY